jgi:hypothetical protein
MDKFLLALLLLLTACTPATAAPPLQVVKIHATAAAQPWLMEASNCAAGSSVILSNVLDPVEADILLLVGEPDHLTTPAFQVDREDLLVVTNDESLAQNLSADEVRALFAGQGQAEVEIWVFALGEDLQQVFAREIMRGTPVSSLARLATSPRQMSDVLKSEKKAIGILGRRWKTDAQREVFSLSNQPVLAIPAAEPQGAVKELLACLQK